MTNKKKNHSLRWIMVVSIGLSMLVFVGIFFSIVQAGMSKMLLQSENEYLNKQLEVVIGMIDSSLGTLRVMTMDVAYWDESADYLQGNNPTYFNNWAGTTVLENNDFDLISINDIKGTEIYSEYLNADGVQAQLPEGLPEYLLHESRRVLERFIALRPKNEFDPAIGLQGIAIHNGTAYALCIMPILRLGDGMVPLGTITYGSKLSDRFLSQLTYSSNTEFEILPLSDDIKSAPLSNEVISRSLNFRDIDGQRIVLRMKMQRTIFTQGQRIIRNTIFMLLTVAVLFTAVLYFILAYMLMRPIERLGVDVSAISTSGSLDTRSYQGYGVELQQLGVEINRMIDRINLVDEIDEARTRLAMALDASSAGIWEFDYTGSIVQYDEATRILFDYEDYGVGYATYEQLIMHLRQRLVGVDPTELLADVTDRDSIGLKCTKEFQIRLEDGTLRYISTFAVTETATDGTLLRTVGMAMDITAAKNAESEIARQLSQQKLMSDMSRSFISSGAKAELIHAALSMVGEFMDMYTVTLTSIDDTVSSMTIEYEWCNTARGATPLSTRRFGFSRQSIMYATLNDREHSFVTDEMLEGSDEVSPLRDPNVKSFVTVPIFIAGELWGGLNFGDNDTDRQWREGDTQLVRMVASVISGVIQRDITERNLVRMSSVADSSPSFVASITRTGQFVFANQGAEELSGYSIGELLGGNVSMLFDEDIYNTLVNEYFPEIANRNSGVYELPLRHRDGEIRIVSFSMFKTGNDGLELGVIAHDVTQQRKLEREIVVAMEQAEQANQAKSEFLSRMSHEMRTPMNAIIGMTNIAKNSDESVRMEYYLDKIEDASKHLLGIINDVLDMSKIEAGKLELNLDRFDFERMLERVITVTNFRIDEKHLKFIIDVDPEIPRYVISDDQRFAQSITNLLSNAAKFTPEYGTIKLSIQILERLGRQIKLRVSVSDNGIGISEEQQSRLFNSFEQADGSISRKYGGTGLGLAITKKILELMGGEMYLTSELGKGSDFYFDISVGVDEFDASSVLGDSIAERIGAGTSDGTKSELPDASNDDAGLFEDKCVLLAEDIDINREIILTLLEDTGLTIDCAENGTEALEMFSKSPERYDLLFMDIHMPEMDGYDATRRIRALGSAHATEVPIIAMTANVFREDVERCLAAGMNDHIGKPVDIDELFEKLRQYLR